MWVFIKATSTQNSIKTSGLMLKTWVSFIWKIAENWAYGKNMKYIYKYIRKGICFSLPDTK